MGTPRRRRGNWCQRVLGRSVMHTRLCKVALLLAVGLFFFIVVLNNAVFDYPSNYGFVQHVLSMDTLFSGETMAWRSYRDPSPADNSYWMHLGFYCSIIFWEASIGVLCALGAFKLLKHRHSPAAAFHAAKSHAVYGLTLSMLLWFTGFITVGGEWFLMWQSSSWNGQEAAFRMFTISGVILLFVLTKNDEPAQA